MIPLRDTNPTRRAPLVTLTLIAACSIAFAWELGVLASSGESGLNRFFIAHGAVPANVGQALESRQLGSEAALGILTSLFLHGSWIHLIGNVLFLWIFGNNVEDRLGRWAFLGFYLVGGFVAALTQVAIDPTSTLPVVGASGAIAATLGAYVVLYPRARILSIVFLGLFFQLIEVPALLVLGFWFVLQLINGITSLGPSSAEGGGVAFFAHIGGFVAGLLIALAVRGRGAGPLRPATVG